MGDFVNPVGYSWEVSKSVHHAHVLCCIAALHMLVSVVAIASYKASIFYYFGYNDLMALIFLKYSLHCISVAS